MSPNDKELEEFRKWKEGNHRDDIIRKIENLFRPTSGINYMPLYARFVFASLSTSTLEKILNEIK